MKDVCQGCQAFGCMFRTYKYEETCPCINCLVKVICNEWCDKRIDASEVVLDLLGDDLEV